MWALFVVLLVALVAFGASSALGEAGNIFSGAFTANDAEALSDAAWSSVFALVIAVASSILGALFAARGRGADAVSVCAEPAALELPQQS